MLLVLAIAIGSIIDHVGSIYHALSRIEMGPLSYFIHDFSLPTLVKDLCPSSIGDLEINVLLPSTYYT